jgi:hypothetical protein
MIEVTRKNAPKGDNMTSSKVGNRNIARPFPWNNVFFPAPSFFISFYLFFKHNLRNGMIDPQFPENI